MDFYVFLGNCFQIIQTKYNWTDSILQCKELDHEAELASIQTESEDSFVKGTCLDFKTLQQRL